MRFRTVPSRECGFTLLELLVVLAIISILAVVALPAYNAYRIRSKVVEGIGLMSSLKSEIAEIYYAQGVMPSSNADLGLEATGALRTGTVDGVSVLPGGIIEASYALPEISANRYLQLAPCMHDQNITWICQSSASNGVESRFLPPQCQHVQGDLTCESDYGGTSTGGDPEDVAANDPGGNAGRGGRGRAGNHGGGHGNAGGNGHANANAQGP